MEVSINIKKQINIKIGGLARPPVIVCPAAKYEDNIFSSCREFDEIMCNSVIKVLGANYIDFIEMGFIDQYDQFYTAEEAYRIVQNNDQTYYKNRNVSKTKLYSRGLY